MSFIEGIEYMGIQDLIDYYNSLDDSARSQVEKMEIETRIEELRSETEEARAEAERESYGHIGYAYDEKLFDKEGIHRDTGTNKNSKGELEMVESDGDLPF
ncbi:MAG: hypothetical protein WC872_00325 [Candidatus Absconditabacterales bacterium]